MTLLFHIMAATQYPLYASLKDLYGKAVLFVICNHYWKQEKSVLPRSIVIYMKRSCTYPN